MKTNGLVGFIEGRSIFSRLIKIFSGIPVSHAVVGFLDDLIVEAAPPKVMVSRLSKYTHKLKRIEFYKVVGLKDKKATSAINDLINLYLDVPYGIKQIIGYGWVILVKIFTGKLIKNPFEDGAKGIICAEFLLYYLRDTLKIREFKNIDINDYNFMGKMYEIIKTSKKFKRVTIK